MRDIRVKAYSNEKGHIERLNKTFENIMERQNEFNQLQRVQLKKVEPYIPEDVRNHPRFGLMTEDELKQAVRKSYEREQEKHDIFKREYLGEWLEGDNNARRNNKIFSSDLSQ